MGQPAKVTSSRSELWLANGQEEEEKEKEEVSPRILFFIFIHAAGYHVIYQEALSEIKDLSF